MSGLDVFAWIVLVILIATIVVVFCLMGALPGHIARRRAGAGRYRRRLGDADLRLCAVAGGGDLAYLDVPAARREPQP
jgi:hypothetical protein